jgi:ATP-binding cassette subfamily B protein
MATMIFVMVPRAQVSAKRINEIMAEKTTVVEQVNPVHIEKPQGRLEFKNVGFQYPNATEPVLYNLNFTVHPGKTTAIIGSTGSGKSTIARLVSRLFDPTDGEILFDGVNTKEMSLEELNRYIGIVPQKPFLFSGTIRSNLRFGKEDATDEEMWKALEIAQAKSFIEAEPGKLDAPVAQGGNNFSGGQRQRLSIARAVVKRPIIYQFDASFSALDYATDAALHKSLKENIKNATTIMISQRVSTIYAAEQIVVLDNGKIEGIGTHRELLDSCDTYREIVESQMTIEEALG